MNTSRRLVSLISPFKWFVVLGVLLGFLTIGSSVGLMAMSAYLISKSALAVEIYEIALTITAVRVFAISRAVFRYLERYFTHTATFRILAYLRVWLFSAIEPLAPARLQHYRGGDLLTRIVADIETLENFYIRVVVPPVTAALVTALTCTILGYFDVYLGIILLVFLLLTGIVLPSGSLLISKHPATALISTRSELNAALVDQIQGIADLILFDQTDRYQSRMLALSRELDHVQQRLAVLRGASNALTALLTGTAALAVLVFGIQLVASGDLDGVYLALLPLTAIASFEAVQPLSLALQQLEANQEAGRRLFELIDASPEVLDPLHASPEPKNFSLEFRELSFRYTSEDSYVLQDVNFVIPSGGCVALVGPNGAGKTTLVNLLLRFWEYQEGTISLGDRELHEYRADDVRKWIGVVSQDVHLFNSTIRDNLLLANPDASDEMIQIACQQAELHDFIVSLPDGYDTWIGENGLLLSGGEHQRLAIARVILKNAPILILDEATANLDSATELRIMDSLKKFVQDCTVIIISHRSNLLRSADQIIYMENGRIVNKTI